MEGSTTGPTVEIPSPGGPFRGPEPPATASTSPRRATRDHRRRGRPCPDPGSFSTPPARLASAALALVLAAGALPVPVGAAAPTRPPSPRRPRSRPPPPTRSTRADAASAGHRRRRHARAAPLDRLRGGDGPRRRRDRVRARRPRHGRLPAAGRTTTGRWTTARRRHCPPGGRRAGRWRRSLQGSRGRPCRARRPRRRATRRGDGADASDAPVDAPGGAPSIAATASTYAAPAAHGRGDLAAARGLRRQVFGFLPYWELAGAVEQDQQRGAVDDRVLLGRRGPRRQPQEEGRRRHATPRAGAAGRART